MDQLTTGAVAAGYAVAGLFFLRFWRDTGDRLFLFFAIALAVLAVNRVAPTVLALPAAEASPTYWIRFAAFALILVGILDKNRPRRPPAAPPAVDRHPLGQPAGRGL